MSKRTTWIGVALILFLLSSAAGTQYVRAAIGHQDLQTATAISPEQLTLTTRALPVTEIESYF